MDKNFGSVGFRVMPPPDYLSSDFINLLKEFSTTEISDHMKGVYSLDSSIKCFIEVESIVANVTTVKLISGDNLMLHKALEVGEPGSFLVVDTSNSNNTAVVGGLIANKAKHLGYAGIIVDGLARDLDQIKELNFPVFARGSSVIGPSKNGPGEVNGLICCGGVAISPTDVIKVDSRGIVVVRKNDIKEVVFSLKEKKKMSEEYENQVKRGNFNFNWVNKILETKG